MKQLFLTFYIILSVSILNGQIQIGDDIDGEAAGDQSGRSVSLSSDGFTLAIGAHLNGGNGPQSGHTRIYRWNGTVWLQLGTDIDGEAAGDRAGGCVSLSENGNTLAIGAVLNDGNGINSGHVRVYDWTGSDWLQKGIDIDGEAAGDFSGGFAVSLSNNGNAVAIGAPDNDGNGQSSGHVRVYNWTGSDWQQKGIDIDGEAPGDRSGASVSLTNNGNTVAIGAGQNNGSTGYVRVYDWDGNAWIQKGLDIDGEAPGDLSGSSVSLSNDGNIVAIGAVNNDGNGIDAGHVRVYEWNGSAWIQKGIDIDGEAAGDRSGNSVSLNSNGNILAVGAQHNSGNGTDAGHVRVYQWENNAWTQIGSDIDGEAAGDRSGHSVSLNSEGNIVAIGAPFNAESGAFAGNTRVFTICLNSAATINISACNSYTVPSGDETYTISGLYNDTIPNMAGCDSIITINLTINQVSTGIDIQTACESFTWIDGNTFTESNNTALYTIVGGGANGCDSIVTLNLSIQSLPIIEATSNSPICEGEALKLNTTELNGATYQWTGPNGFTSQDQNPVINSTTIFHTGAYQVIASLGNNCADTAQVNVVVNPVPILNSSIVDDNCGEEEGEITIEVVSPNQPLNYTWSNGSSEPIITGLSEGVYEVIVTDNVSCSAFRSFYIINNTDNCNCFIYVANAFSPNGDNNNDYIPVRGECVRQLTFKIFNKWGNLVFETHELNAGWDGYYQGKLQNTGVYIYLLEATFEDGRSVTESGDISLIR